MGILVDTKTKEYVSQGLAKKEARLKAHEYCKVNSICRGCSEVVRPDQWSMFTPKLYCNSCMS